MGTDGTPRRIGPIADQVLAWVAVERLPGPCRIPRVTSDDLRRIELCALAAREAAMFHDLYGMDRMCPSGHLDFIGGDPHAPAPEVPE